MAARTWSTGTGKGLLQDVSPPDRDQQTHPERACLKGRFSVRGKLIWEVGLQNTSLTSHNLLFHMLLPSALNYSDITISTNRRSCEIICPRWRILFFSLDLQFSNHLTTLQTSCIIPMAHTLSATWPEAEGFFFLFFILKPLHFY